MFASYLLYRTCPFWLSEWARAQSVWGLLKLFRQISAHMRAGVLITPVAATYTLDEIQTAVIEAEKGGMIQAILHTAQVCEDKLVEITGKAKELLADAPTPAPQQTPLQGSEPEPPSVESVES